MADTPRPLSPHLQIYRPQLTSVLSILHRGTGVFLSLGALLLAYWLLAAAAGPEIYARAARHINAWYGQFVLFLFVFSFYYHLCNGVRHMFWDIGAGLEIRTTYRSGYVMLAATIVLTVLTCFRGVFA